ncbi:MAG: sugar phosphate isomerase/epimerase family protein, partial [Candidatus Bathyarchaeia archaeon]
IYQGFLSSWDRSHLTKLSEVVHSQGLEVSMFAGYNNFGYPDKSELEKQISLLKRNVDAALVFGTRIVRVVSGSWHPGLSRDQALINVAECLRKSVEYAEERGVTLALEDHPQIGTRSADFMKILRLADTDELKVNLDTSNPMVSGEDAVDLVKLVKDRVVHVHASDRNENLEHIVVGEGVVKFPQIFQGLKGGGFDDWISLEVGGEEGKEGIRRSMAYVRETWKAA